jgi:hypothetical protein
MDIPARIQKLKAQLLDLTAQHDAMIAQHNQAEQEFNQAVIRSQQRYQQTAGAIAELELMLQEETQTNNGEESLPSRLKR